MYANDSLKLKQVKVMDCKASIQMRPGNYWIVIKTPGTIRLSARKASSRALKQMTKSPWL